MDLLVRAAQVAQLDQLAPLGLAVDNHVDEDSGAFLDLHELPVAGPSIALVLVGLDGYDDDGTASVTALPRARHGEIQLVADLQFTSLHSRSSPEPGSSG